MERNKLIDEAADKLEADDSLTAKDVREMINAIPGIRRFIVACALRGLTARKYFFDRKTQRMEFEPDSATQLKAAAFLAAYADGLPVQTALNVNIDPAKGGGITLGDALANSPALREHLAKELAASERKAIAA